VSHSWLGSLPDLESLTAHLRAALPAGAGSEVPLSVLERRPMPFASSSPSEIVTCRVDDGPVLQLYCKYGARHGREDHRHRGDRRYEAAVYREVLQPLGLSTPLFYGSSTSSETGETLLVLEYLGPCPRVNEAADCDALLRAARWIGRFHSLNEAHPSAAALFCYRAEYYLGWARRTAEFAAPLQRRFPWLGELCDGFEQVAACLLAPPRDLIHGEYYPHNILFRDGVVHPIDWESAALAPGEIDLASLTDRWPAAIAADCTREYVCARWAEGAPPAFARRLDAARMYLQLRWLGDRPEWTLHERLRWRFRELRRLGKRWGLV